MPRTNYLASSLNPSSPQTAGGLLLPRPEIWVRADSVFRTDGAIDFVAADRSHLAVSNFNFDCTQEKWWFACWVNVKQRHAGDIVAYYTGGSAGTGIRIYCSNNGPTNVIQTYSAVSAINLPCTIGYWHFLTCFKEFDTLYMSLDLGEFVGRGYVGNKTTGSMLLGKHNGDGGYLDGLLDSVMWGNSYSGITKEEIRNYLYNGGTGRNHLDLSSSFKTSSALRNSYDGNEEKGVRVDRQGDKPLSEVFYPIVTPSGVSYGPNLVINSNFEETLNPWQLHNDPNDGGTASVERNTISPISGIADLKVSRTTAGNNLSYPRIVGATSTAYKLQQRYRCNFEAALSGVDSSVGQARVGAALTNGGGFTLVEGIGSYSTQFVTGAAPANYPQISLSIDGRNECEVQLDNVSVQEVISGTRNGGFEVTGVGSQPFADWLTSYTGAGQAEIHRDLAEKYSGDASCRLDKIAPGPAGHFGIYQTGFTSGKRYTISGFAKASRSGVRLTLRSPIAPAEIDLVGLGTEWAPFSLSGVCRNGQLMLANYAGDGLPYSIWLDEVSITPAEIKSAPGIIAGYPGQGDPVLFWKDNITGHGRQFTIPEIERRPAFQTGPVSLRFDGVDDRYETTLPGPEDRTIYLIARINSFTGSSGSVMVGGISGNYEHAIDLWRATGNLSVRTMVLRSNGSSAMGSGDIGITDTIGSFILIKSWREGQTLGIRVNDQVRQTVRPEELVTAKSGVRLFAPGVNWDVREFAVVNGILSPGEEAAFLQDWKYRNPTVNFTPTPM